MFAKGPMPGATPKADALKHYPSARAHEWADGWVIYCGEQVNRPIGFGKTAMLAWRNVTLPAIRTNLNNTAASGGE